MFALDMPVGYNPYEFLPWVAKHRSLSVARVWAKRLSPNATFKSYRARAPLQLQFNRLYEDFILSTGGDPFSVWYEEKIRQRDAETLEAKNEARRITYSIEHDSKPKRTYEIVAEEEASNTPLHLSM
jgi:hypothetical protein